MGKPNVWMDVSNYMWWSVIRNIDDLMRFAFSFHVLYMMVGNSPQTLQNFVCLDVLNLSWMPF